ncbi:hypothetical protein BN1326_140098 [Staphylococcus argenteus]|uniref:Uncharacterized protein n=1 Tax=Staphylococcus argenteus TaxID=985002 RepID=A0A7U7JQX8_9STAP|nr:hypothetical protein BN1326_140098 [Staphylococcus argenteus]CRI14190.1 hypothetical protein BN1326_140098 [Staphylococcus argenteus]
MINFVKVTIVINRDVRIKQSLRFIYKKRYRTLEDFIHEKISNSNYINSRYRYSISRSRTSCRCC